MSGLGGLIELVLACSFVLGWGALELRGVHLDKKKAEAAKKAVPGDEPKT